MLPSQLLGNDFKFHPLVPEEKGRLLVTGTLGNGVVANSSRPWWLEQSLPQGEDKEQ